MFFANKPYRDINITTSLTSDAASEEETRLSDEVVKVDSLGAVLSVSSMATLFSGMSKLAFFCSRERERE